MKDEDMANDFPHRDGDMVIIIDLDNGQILDWKS
jgi:hypothetical protein